MAEIVTVVLVALKLIADLQFGVKAIGEVKKLEDRLSKLEKELYE